MGMESATKVQILDKVVAISLHANAQVKGPMNPSVISPHHTQKMLIFLSNVKNFF